MSRSFNDGARAPSLRRLLKAQRNGWRRREDAAAEEEQEGARSAISLDLGA